MDDDTKAAILATQGDEFSKKDLLDLGEEAAQKEEVPSNSHWEQAKEILDFAFKIVLIIAGIFGALEYYDRVHQDKVLNALGVVDDWEDQGYLSDLLNFRIVGDALLSEGEKKHPGNRQSATRSAANRMCYALDNPPNFAAVLSSLKLGAIQKPDYHQYIHSIERLNYFFSKVGLCVRDDICETELMTDYFGSSSCYFFDLMETRINTIRIENNNSDYSEFAQYFCRISQKN